MVTFPSRHICCDTTRDSVTYYLQVIPTKRWFHNKQLSVRSHEPLPRILRLRDVLLEEVLEVPLVLEVLDPSRGGAPSVPNTAEPTADALPSQMRARHEESIQADCTSGLASPFGCETSGASSAFVSSDVCVLPSSDTWRRGGTECDIAETLCRMVEKDMSLPNSVCSLSTSQSSSFLTHFGTRRLSLLDELGEGGVRVWFSLRTIRPAAGSGASNTVEFVSILRLANCGDLGIRAALR